MPRSVTPGMPANYHGAVRCLAIVLVAACGRFGFEQPSGDGAVTATGDAPAVAPANLVAYYPMDSLIGGMMADATGHSHWGICQTAVLPTNCPSVGPGRLGNAYYFQNGTNVYIMAAPELQTSSGFTIAAWLQIAAAPSARACALDKPVGSGTFDSWSMCVEPTRTLFYYSVSGTIENKLTSVATLGAGGWHHVALTWDGATKITWLDGSSVATSLQSAISFDTSVIYLGIDADNGVAVTPFTGAIDELRIYDRALTASELGALAR